MSKEWKVGKHNVVLDDVNNVLIVNANGDFDADDVKGYIRVTKEAFPEGTTERKIMIMFSNSLSGAMMTKETRESLKKTFQEAEDKGKDRIAIVSASPSIKMMFKVFSRTLGLATNQFFKSEEEAMVWLKKGEK